MELYRIYLLSLYAFICSRHLFVVFNILDGCDDRMDMIGIIRA